MNTININHRAEKIHHKIHRHAKNHIHKMRGKTNNHKKIYAFTFSFIVTLIVFMLWYFLSLPKIIQIYYINKSENQRINYDPLDKVKKVFENKENTQLNNSDTNISNIELIEQQNQ